MPVKRQMHKNRPVKVKTTPISCSSLKKCDSIFGVFGKRCGLENHLLDGLQIFLIERCPFGKIGVNCHSKGFIRQLLIQSFSYSRVGFVFSPPFCFISNTSGCLSQVVGSLSDQTSSTIS